MGGRGSSSASGGGGKGGGGAVPAVTLPDLQGSEKQIAWANDIRANFVEETQRNLADLQSENSTFKESYERAYGSYADVNMQRDVTDMKAALSVVGNVTEARDWIDGRRSPMKMLTQRPDFALAKENIRRIAPKKKSSSKKKPSILEMLLSGH